MDDEGNQKLIDSLRRIAGPDSAELNIGQAALVLGALDRPGTNLEPYLDHLKDIESAVESRKNLLLSRAQESGPREATGPRLTLQLKAGVLAQVLAVDYGYRGDHMTYDDLRNANLLDVIDRRQGLPVALGILYLHAARSQGWRLDGLNVPGHFVVRLADADDAVILDPFNGGRILDEGDLADLRQQFGGGSGALTDIRSVSGQEILLRLQNNIMTRSLQSGMPEKAIEILERMRLVAPDSPELAFDLGSLRARVGWLIAAVEAFDDCLALEPEPALARRAREALTSLRRQLN